MTNIAVERLFTPFPGIGRHSDGTYPELVPLQYLKSWGQSARNGYYPFAANAQWHGGIHFDASTGTRFYQEDGVRCIADGEVIAYRYNHEPLFIEDDSSRKCHYSTGFVLVRHKLQLPREVMPQTTPASAALPEVTLYSLNMHMLHINSYLYNPRLDRPTFWTPYPNRWRVAANANDAQPPRTANASWAPDGADVSQPEGAYLRRRDNKENVAWLPCGAQLTLGTGTGDWRPVASVGSEQFSAPAPNSGTLSSLAHSPLYNSPYLLWRKPGTENIALDQLEIRADFLEKVLEPPTRFDEVIIPANPIPIAAAALVGHVGIYLRPEDVAAHETDRKQFHLELFAASSALSGFIATCRGHAQNAPERAKTLIKLDRGARLVQPSQADLTIPAGEAVRLDDNSPVGGPWYLMRRGTLQEVASNTLQGFDRGAQSYGGRLLYRARTNNGTNIAAANNIPPITGDISANRFGIIHKEGTPTQQYTPSAAKITFLNAYTRKIVFVDSGQTVWLDRQTYWRLRAAVENSNRNNIIRLNAPLPVWTDFPLSTNQNLNPQTNNDLLIIEKKTVEVFASDSQGNRWWYVSYPGPNNSFVRGWACGTGHANIEFITPWAWPGFETVEEDTTAPLDYDRMRRNNQFPRNGHLFNALFRIIDPVNRPALSLPDICAAWQNPQLVQAISRLVIRHRSEWGMDMALWNAIDSEVGEANKEAWRKEKTRIEKQKFWDGVSGQHGFPSAIVMDHMHPLALIDNFEKRCRCTTPGICDAPYREFRVPQGVMRISEEAFDLIRREEGYMQRPYFPGDAGSGVTLGYGYDLGQQTAAQINQDLAGLYTQAEINCFVAVSGAHFRGNNARAALNPTPDTTAAQTLRAITINRQNAGTLLIRTAGTYCRKTASIYPEALRLHPHCQGMLLSLVYNRGEVINADPGRREMGHIQQDFLGKKTELIPDRFRLMGRLWMDTDAPGVSGRRNQEAVLFTRGLQCTCFENK